MILDYVELIRIRGKSALWKIISKIQFLKFSREAASHTEMGGVIPHNGTQMLPDGDVC